MSHVPPAPHLPRSRRLAGFGTTVFAEMTALADRTGAINLGQGFPDTDGPAEIVDAAVAALREGHNQYAPARGVPQLRRAVADHSRRHYGLQLDPDRQVQITFGATEALSATMLALLDAGDEVIVLEPYYDAYAVAIAMAGGVRRTVALRAPDFRLDTDALRAAVTPRTKLVLLNSPHNPTGRVMDRDELQAVADLCTEHDLVAVTDEVYEHLTFEGAHIPLATLPGMAERTLRISSAGKTFSFTGWKVGWVTGPAALVDAVASVKAYLSFSGGTPLQHAVAVALDRSDAFHAPLVNDLRAARDTLCAALTDAGLTVHIPRGTYFVNADIAAVGLQDGEAFCRSLPERCGVVAIPTVAFCDDASVGRSLVRFAFCKRPEVIAEASARLRTLAR